MEPSRRPPRLWRYTRERLVVNMRPQHRRGPRDGAGGWSVMAKKPQPYRFAWEQALRDAEIDAGAKYFGLMLATYADIDGTIPEKYTPGNRALAIVLGWTRPTVTKYSEMLAKAGWIMSWRDGTGRKYRYRLVIPDGREVANHVSHSGSEVANDVGHNQISTPEPVPDHSSFDQRSTSLRDGSAAPNASLRDHLRDRLHVRCTCDTAEIINGVQWSEIESRYDGSKRHRDEFFGLFQLDAYTGPEDAEEKIPVLTAATDMLDRGDDLVKVAKYVHAKLCTRRADR